MVTVACKPCRLQLSGLHLACIAYTSWKCTLHILQPVLAAYFKPPEPFLTLTLASLRVLVNLTQEFALSI